jgi:hypothetical protein
MTSVAVLSSIHVRARVIGARRLNAAPGVPKQGRRRRDAGVEPFMRG